MVWLDWFAHITYDSFSGVGKIYAQDASEITLADLGATDNQQKVKRSVIRITPYLSY